MQRMPRKQRRHKRRRPDFSVIRSNSRNNRTALAAWKQDVDEMLRARVRAEDAGIEHVRKPRERMPVAGVPGGERPFHSRPRESRAHVRVADVNRVVENHRPACRTGEYASTVSKASNRQIVRERAIAPLCGLFRRWQQARIKERGIYPAGA